MIWARDQSNVRTDFRYNSALQLEATVDSANVGATAREARYQYDNFGRLSRLTNAKGQNTIYTYDRLNRIDKVTYPGGLIDEQFTYDEIGNVLTVRKGDNTTISYDYDDSNRLEKISHPSLSPSITYGYNDNDRRTTMTDETGTTSWTYNKKGQILTVAAPLTGTLEYTYDDIGRLETITDPEDVATTYTYTDRNLMASVNQDGQTISYTYDPVGNLSGKTLPNGVNCNMNYDELNRLTRLEYAQGMNAPFFSEDYALDKVGNLKRNISRTSSGTDVFRYDYDKLYRVTEVEQKVGGSFSPIETFAYDAQDNITSFNGETFSHNAADQLTSALSSSIDYDGNGNAEQIQGSSNRTITTNYADLPTEIRTGTTVNGAYTYNGDRQRVVRTAMGVFGAQTTFRYLWSGSEILKDYHGNGNTRASYILGVGREAIKNSNDDGWRFYITDRLGSTRYMTDASGNITDSYTYTAYGAIKTSTSTPPSNGGDFGTYYNPFLFTGQQYDSGEGNYYLRNRYYVPAYGRFLVADPIRYQGGMNLYAYCAGNPVNFTDPDGLQRRGSPRNNIWRARQAIRRMVRQANRAHRQRVHQNLGMLGMKNLNIQGLSLTRGSNALYRRGFVFTGMSVGRNLPTELVGEAVYFNFWNPYTRTSVIWDAGNSQNSYASTRSSHWTISRPERGERGEWYNHRGDVVERTSREAHVYSEGFGEGTFYRVETPFFERNAVIPEGFPDPPLGDKPAWLGPGH